MTTHHETALSAVNTALVHLGMPEGVSNLDDQSGDKISRSAALLYEGIRRRVLTDMNWGFARKDKIVGSADSFSATMDKDYPCEISVPMDSVRVMAVYDNSGEQVDWKLFGRKIRTSRPATRVVYIADVQDIDEWSSDAQRALTYRIAADLAIVAGAPNMKSTMEQLYSTALADAKLADARQSNSSAEAWGDNYYAEAMKGRDRVMGGFGFSHNPFWG